MGPASREPAIIITTARPQKKISDVYSVVFTSPKRLPPNIWEITTPQPMEPPLPREINSMVMVLEAPTAARAFTPEMPPFSTEAKLPTISESAMLYNC